MTDAVVRILDAALVTALWIFLIGCCLYAAGSALATRRKNRRTIQGLQSRFSRSNQGAIEANEAESWRSYVQEWNWVEAGLKAALWSALAACLAFLFLCFSPWPRMANFATLTDTPPLRVTFLFVEPTSQGFRFQGDVWNQHEAPISARVAIDLLDSAGHPVQTVLAPLEPQSVRAREKAQFHASTPSPTQASDFRLRFLGLSGEELTYAKGFPQ